MAYKLDSNKAEVRLLSNDAFFWLKDEEDPIDEDNLEEAYEILNMFTNGFVIAENWKYVDDDTVEATFIPYVEDVANINWDGESRCVLTNGETDRFVFLFKKTNNSEAYVRWFNELNGRMIYEGPCKVEKYFGNDWAITPKGSQIPLFGKGVKLFNKNT